MKIRPLHDWAVVRRTDDAEKTAGGIIIPAVAREKRAEGIVEAVGPGKFTSRGEGKKERFVATTVKPGQRVMFPGFSAREVEVDGRKVTLVREEDILGTVEESAHKERKESVAAKEQSTPRMTGSAPQAGKTKQERKKAAGKPAKPGVRKRAGAVKKKEVKKEKEERAKKSAAGPAKKTVKKPAAGKKTSAGKSTGTKARVKKKETPKVPVAKKKKTPAGRSRKRK